MLNWFARRLKEAQEKDKTGQGGFTLIELLVVVIIIGILATIAIPVFLSQRARAVDARVESDARNAATAEEAIFANTEAYAFGTFGEGDPIPATGDRQMTVSENVRLVIADDKASGYTITGTATEGGSGATTVYSSATGTIETTPAP